MGGRIWCEGCDCSDCECVAADGVLLESVSDGAPELLQAILETLQSIDASLFDIRDAMQSR